MGKSLGQGLGEERVVHPERTQLEESRVALSGEVSVLSVDSAYHRPGPAISQQGAQVTLVLVRDGAQGYCSVTS